jgi:hypothetical protein
MKIEPQLRAAKRKPRIYKMTLDQYVNATQHKSVDEAVDTYHRLMTHTLLHSKRKLSLRVLRHLVELGYSHQVFRYLTLRHAYGLQDSVQQIFGDSEIHISEIFSNGNRQSDKAFGNQLSVKTPDNSKNENSDVAIAS